MARPTTYTREIGELICSKIIEGNSLRSILLSSEDMPDYSTFFRWLTAHTELRNNYDVSTKERTLAMGEEILDIADDGTNDYMAITKGDKTYNVEDREVTNRSKLRVETRKWLMSKMLPKKYGDKMDLTSGGKPIPILGHVPANNSAQEVTDTQETN